MMQLTATKQNSILSIGRRLQQTSDVVSKKRLKKSCKGLFRRTHLLRKRFEENFKNSLEHSFIAATHC